MRKIFSILAAFVVLTWVSCNNDTSETNGNTRYIDEIFTFEKTSNIEFAEAESLIWVQPYSITSQNITYSKDLDFDLYQPEGDTATDRPLIIMAFGGAFVVGTKIQPELVSFCESMAKRGYVVASIDYRLGFNVFDDDTAVRAVYRGAQDVISAILYFKGNAAQYGIDPDKIFVGGNSAGSISAIHAAYGEASERSGNDLFSSTYDVNGWPDLGEPTEGNTASGLNYLASGDYNVAGIVNLWGAIGDLDLINDAQHEPMISFYGDADGIVSPYSGAPFEETLSNLPGVSGIVTFPVLHGSVPMHDQLNSLGIYNEIHNFAGEGHEPWRDENQAIEINDKTAEFLHSLL